jgi:hypothetical protein
MSLLASVTGCCRLLGYNVVVSPKFFGKFSITTGANTNGVGHVYTKDVTTVLRQRGRRVSYKVYW